MKYLRFALVTLLLVCIMANSSALASSCYVGCETCRQDSDCADCAFCIAVCATARPRETTVIPVVTQKPALSATPAPTKMPHFTAKPTAAPTIRPSMTQKPSVSTGDYTTLSTARQEEIVFQLLNMDRQKNGLSPLPLDPELSRIARIKSQDMKDNRYFAHESPTFGRAPQMLTHFGYAYNGVGENIAHHSTAEKAEAAFMSSWGHRINILGKQWTKVGIGVVYDDQGYLYITQLFVR